MELQRSWRTYNIVIVYRHFCSLKLGSPKNSVFELDPLMHMGYYIIQLWGALPIISGSGNTPHQAMIKFIFMALVRNVASKTLHPDKFPGSKHYKK